MEIPSDTEETLLSTGWDPQEWILNGKRYHDVPPVVEFARRDVLQILGSFAQNRPSKTMSITQLLRTDLPPMSSGVDGMDIDFDFFDYTEPAKDIEDILFFLALPTRAMLATMNQEFGQAWFDGKKLIRTWINPDVAYPFWVLTYWETWLNGRGKTAEEATLKLTPIRLAAIFSSNYLGTDIVDALISLLSFRLRLSDNPMSNKTLIVDTHFASFLGMLLPIVNGAAAEHWTARSLDFSARTIRYGDSLGWKRPKEFFDALEFWLHNSSHPNFVVTDDLPCAKQTDGFSCPIIAVNTIAHNALGDPVWTPQNAKAMRMKAFCDIVKHALSAKNIAQPMRTPNPSDCADNILAANPDFNDDFLAGPTGGTDTVLSQSYGTTSGPGGDSSKSKAVKGKKSAKNGSQTLPKSTAPPNPSIGASKSATCARNLRIQVQNGEFQPSEGRTQGFRASIRQESDKNTTFEPNSKAVQCSVCKKWVQGKEPYNTSRFIAHWKKGCKGTAPPPPPPSDTKTRTLLQFALVPLSAAKPKKAVGPAKISVPCPGLTAAFSDKVGYYLERSNANGGGGRAVGYYSEKLFQKEFQDLNERKNELVIAAQQHDHTWRNNVTEGVDVKVVESPPPCDSCLLLFTSRAYQNIINKPQPDPKNLCHVPHKYQNAHAGRLFAKFHGLEALFSEDNEFSLERRYVEHVLDGSFKNDAIFNGIIQAKVLAKTARSRAAADTAHERTGRFRSISLSGVNDLSSRKLRALHGLLSAYKTKPGYAEQYGKDYGYPLGAPLSLSVNDTKLHAALRPLYNGPLGKWFIIGTTGESTEVPDADTLNDTLDELEKTAEVATKLRLWVLQIPLPGVPPLVLAIMPIGPKVKGTQLAEWQLALMRGLIHRGFRVTSSGGDGASVERECQRLTAVASKLIEYRIKHPDPDYPDIIVTVWELNGNVWVEIQDAKHGWTKELSKQRVPVYSLPILLRKQHKSSKKIRACFGDFIDAYQSPTLSHHERAKIAIRTYLFLHTWCSFLQKAGYPESRDFITKEAFAISEILDINFALLGQYPTDVELSLAYKIATEENDCLWTLLGIHPNQIKATPVPSLVPQPTPDPVFEHLYLNKDDLAGQPDSAEPTAAEEVQQMVDNLQSTIGLSPSVYERLDEQLDACVMASVALSMDQLARIEDLPDSDPERFTEIQRDIAHAMTTQPAAFISLFQDMVTATMGNATENPPSSCPLADVSSSDLEPLVALHQAHQTKEERMGVRTYKASGTYTTPKT
ncbi:hypothetical protein B0H14DRAFT_3684172 [Mycena olivaceomarginata]|nr:hypothetical protein B0H14DRAFT_3684172 [Mycena olivaceomarginata]